jgi:hypothetical protein
MKSFSLMSDLKCMRSLGYPSPNPWNKIRTDLVSGRRGPVIAVVGYIGVDAPNVMPLRAGDSLVCDASPSAIKSRLTSTKALLDYDRKGVAIYSLEDLHAKVIASRNFAWVGSTNASVNSRDNLIEASVRIAKANAIPIFTWAEKLTVEDRALSTDDIRDLAKIPLDPTRRGPKTVQSKPPHKVPADLSRLVFYSVGPASTKEERIAEKSRTAAKKTAKAVGLPSSLGYLVWDGPTRARAGDWIIQVSRGHVLRPAYVVRVAREGTSRVLWFSYVKSRKKPRIAEIRMARPEIDDEFEEFVLSGRKSVGKVLRLFGIS